MDSLLFPLSAATLALLTWRYGSPLDNYVHAMQARILKSRRVPPHPLAQAVASIQRIQAHLKAGKSLQGVLEEICTEKENGADTLSAAKKALTGEADGSAMGAILVAGVHQGAPVSEALSGLKRAFASQLRSERKARALTTQARLQSIIAGFLPVLLFATLASIEPDLLFAADRLELSLALLLVAAALDITGIFWLRRMFHRAFHAKNAHARELEIFLPACLTNVIGKLAVGIDVDAAFEQSAPPQTLAPFLRAAILAPDSVDKNSLPYGLQQALAARERAKKLGAPIRADLGEILTELESEREARWEEAAQSLPIQMLLPLFVCIFPANMTILAIPILPGIMAF